MTQKINQNQESLREIREREIERQKKEIRDYKKQEEIDGKIRKLWVMGEKVKETRKEGPMEEKKEETIINGK